MVRGHPHGSYLTLGRPGGLGRFDLWQSWALGISEEVVEEGDLLLNLLYLLSMLVEDVLSHKFGALAKVDHVRTQGAL